MIWLAIVLGIIGLLLLGISFWLFPISAILWGLAECLVIAHAQDHGYNIN